MSEENNVWDYLCEQASTIINQDLEDHKKKHPDHGYNYEHDIDDLERLLTPSQLCATLLGNLFSQVNNGGFMQYIENGYGKEIKGIIEIVIGKYYKEYAGSFDKTKMYNLLNLLEGDIEPLLDDNGEIDYPDLSRLNIECEDFWKTTMEEGMQQEFERWDNIFNNLNQPNNEFEGEIKAFLNWVIQKEVEAKNLEETKRAEEEQKAKELVQSIGFDL